MARERRHHVTAISSAQNTGGSALSGDKLREVDMVIDFTTPSAVGGNIEACLRARKNMVVGTTGWFAELESVRAAVYDDCPYCKGRGKVKSSLTMSVEIQRKLSEEKRQRKTGQRSPRGHRVRFQPAGYSRPWQCGWVFVLAPGPRRWQCGRSGPKPAKVPGGGPQAARIGGGHITIFRGDASDVRHRRS